MLTTNGTSINNRNDAPHTSGRYLRGISRFLRRTHASSDGDIDRQLQSFLEDGTMAPTPAHSNGEVTPPFTYPPTDLSDDEFFSWINVFAPTPSPLYDGSVPYSPTYRFSDDYSYHNDDDTVGEFPMESIGIFFFVGFVFMFVCVAFFAKTNRNTESTNTPRRATRGTTPQPSASRTDTTTQDRRRSNRPHPDTVNSIQLRTEVLKILLPEQRIAKDQLKENSETFSYRWTSGHPANVLNEKTNTSCSICIERFGEGDLVIAGLCKHAYHKDCVMDWILGQNSCPNCRQPMFDEGTYRLVEEQIEEMNRGEEV